MNKLIVIVGCSSCGKDTILKKIVQSTNVIPVISTTSRPMRTGEVNGREYNFISYEESKNMLDKGMFIEHRSYNVIDDGGNIQEWIYGITKDSVPVNDDNNYIAIVDYNGLKELVEYVSLYGKHLTSVYIDCNELERLNRSISRQRKELEDNPVKVYEICRRMIDDMKNVMPSKSYCDIILKNQKKEDLDYCINVIRSLLR